MRGRSADRRRAKAGGRGPRGNPVKAKAKAKVKTRDAGRAVKPALARPAPVRGGVAVASRSNGVAATGGKAAGREEMAAKASGSERAARPAALDSNGVKGGPSSALGSLGFQAGVTASTAGVKGRPGRERFRGVAPGPEAARPEPPPLPTPIASFTL